MSEIIREKRKAREKEGGKLSSARRAL